MELQLLSILIFVNLFEAIVSCSMGQRVKEPVDEIKEDDVLKRQQRSDFDGDSSEVFGGVSDRDLIYNMFNSFKPPTLSEVKRKTPTTTVTQLSMNETDTVTDDRKNCSCKPSNKQNGTNQSYKISDHESNRKNDRDMYIVEKHYDEEKYISKKNSNSDKNESGDVKDEEEKDQSTVTKQPSITTLRPISTNAHYNYQKGDQDTQYDIEEIDNLIDSAIREYCPNYKEVPDLDVQRMADVWQLAYYKADEILSCFKIFIKRTSPQGRRRYEEKYSSFNDTIKWHDCLLELVSTGKLRDDKRHYLQAIQSNKGILDNIIISVHDDKDNKIITLQEQTPDQWLVTQNLLLMRDCGTGDVVVFTRVPSKPTWDEVKRAMRVFGESDNAINGTEPCEVRQDDVKDGDVLRYKKYQLS